MIKLAILGILLGSAASCSTLRSKPSTVAAGTITRASVPPRCGVVAFAGVVEVALAQAPTGYDRDTMLVVVPCLGDSPEVERPLGGRDVRLNVAPIAELQYGWLSVLNDIRDDLPLFGLLNREGAEWLVPEWVDL